MNQPESDRATAEDYAWIEELARKCEAGENHGDIGYRVVWNARYRRILNSLRAPAVPAVPLADRERLARALYITDGEVGEEEGRATWAAEFWNEPGARFTHNFWRGRRADRLQRVLGGFPVATEPWESLALTAEHCSSLEMDVRQLREALQAFVRIAVDDLPCEYGGNGMDADHCERCASIVNGRAALAATAPPDPRPSTVATPRQD